MGARFVAAPRSLRGKETLGLEPIQDLEAHDNGYIPIPPMLDYQIDTMTIRWMQELTKGMLKDLWKVLLRRNPGDWFHVFLTIFILLNTAEIAYKAQLDYVRDHGGVVSPQTVSTFITHHITRMPAISDVISNNSRVLCLNNGNGLRGI